MGPRRAYRSPAYLARQEVHGSAEDGSEAQCTNLLPCKIQNYLVWISIVSNMERRTSVLQGQCDVISATATAGAEILETLHAAVAAASKDGEEEIAFCYCMAM